MSIKRKPITINELNHPDNGRLKPTGCEPWPSSAAPHAIFSTNHPPHVCGLYDP